MFENFKNLIFLCIKNWTGKGQTRLVCPEFAIFHVKKIPLIRN
jgi:hypothetical protein